MVINPKAAQFHTQFTSILHSGLRETRYLKRGTSNDVVTFTSQNSGLRETQYLKRGTSNEVVTFTSQIPSVKYNCLERHRSVRKCTASRLPELPEGLSLSAPSAQTGSVAAVFSHSPRESGLSPG